MRTFLSRITNTEQSKPSRAGAAKARAGGASAKKSAKGGRAKAGGGSRPGARTRPGRKSGASTGAKAGAKRRPASGGTATGAAGMAGGLRRWWTGREHEPGKTGGAAQRTSKWRAERKTEREQDAAKSAPASRSADERRGPSGFVRVLAMLLAFAGMVAFAGVLSRLTLEPSAASASIAHTNLEPGSSIQAYLSQPAFQDTVKQLGGNIVLGIPFGLLLPVLVPRARGLLRVTLATAVVMLLVELVQGALINGRAFDVDDVILNCSGALLGYLLLGRRLGLAVHPPRRRWWQRMTGRPVVD